MNNKIFFYLGEDNKGYPFFKLSSFKLWILYKDKNKRIRYSIETDTTISQLIYGRIQNLILDKISGYNKLTDLVNRQAEYINKAIIYWNGTNNDKNEIIAIYEAGKWKIVKELNKESLRVNYPFTIEGKKLIINLNTEK
jgi:hypothetical protein